MVWAAQPLGSRRHRSERAGDLDEKIGEQEKNYAKGPRRRTDSAADECPWGIGTVCAMAIQAFAPPMESFRCGRDFAA